MTEIYSKPTALAVGPTPLERGKKRFDFLCKMLYNNRTGPVVDASTSTTPLTWGSETYQGPETCLKHIK